MKFFLIGLMGSGKTYWAKKLGAVLHLPAFDLDTEIEKAAGRTVSDVFAAEGEQAFRLRERDLLRSFGEKKAFIVSTGGGAPCFHDNMEWMNAHGTTIWIDEPPSTIAQRLKHGKRHRPLIANVPDDELEAFFIGMREKRKPFYAKASHQITGCSSVADFLPIFSLYE